jgi:hypothetical protein
VSKYDGNTLISAISNGDHSHLSPGTSTFEASGLQHLNDFGNATKLLHRRKQEGCVGREKRESNREQVDLDEMRASDR